MKYQLNLMTTWSLFFFLTFLEAVAGFIFVLVVPSEISRGILGYSASRWAIMFPLLIAAGASLWAAAAVRRNSEFQSRWLSPGSKPALFRLLTLAAILMAFVTGSIAFLLRWFDPPALLPYFERSWPLLAFVLLFSFQSLLWLSYLRFGWHKRTPNSLRAGLIAFALLMLVYIFISLTKLGITPDKAYWGEPGVPIQGWQFFFVLMIGALYLVVTLLPGSRRHPRRTDIFTILLVYSLALGVWLSVPNEVLRNSFYFPIDPPANLPFPYSDSGYYDYNAQSLLIGTDYLGNIPTRPLYIVLLAGLHLLFGERYDLIILGQTVALACIPVMLYLLGRKIFSRTAGFTIALFAIAREWTNLLVSSGTRVSNTKTLLVDVPTFAVILLACLFALRWIQHKDRFSAFLAGGTFGMLLLLRTQTMLILPILLLLALLSFRNSRNAWISSSLVFLLGLLIAITPWLTHNYLQTGKFTFDAPFQQQVLASQYAYTGNLDYGQVDLEGKSLLGILITFVIKDPGFVAGFILNHFLATEIGALLALPLIQPFQGMLAPIYLYWTSFNGQLSWLNHLLLVGYLAFIALGLASAWQKWRWAGLVPLGFNLGYALANGIGRFSGWRYDYPADWIAYFYFGIGFIAFLHWLVSVFGAHEDDSTDISVESGHFSNQPGKVWIGVALIFILIGSSPWVAQVLSIEHFQEKSPETLQSELLSFSGTQELQPELQSFLKQKDAVTIQGRALYPRYFGRNSGLTSSTPWQSYAPREYPRFGFLLLDDNVVEVVFPFKGLAVGNFHAQDVLLLGCQRKSYFETRVLVLVKSGRVFLSDFGLEPCSL
jgi:hypothetical protein